MENKLCYLINVGNIHLYQPYCFGGARRLPPGSSMQNDSQTSPSTLAYDVKMSAKITSEKYTRWFMGDDIHLLMLLEVPDKCVLWKNSPPKKGLVMDKDVQDERVALWLLDTVEWRNHAY
jgi:hypothetical protein